MKKLRSILLAAIIVCSMLFAVNRQNIFTAHAQRDNNDRDNLSITLLHPYIEKAVTDYYGFFRLYEIGSSDIEILERNGNIFTVKVTVVTFEGPHNDYFTEVLTFIVTPSEVTLKSYTHGDFVKR